MPSPPVPHIAVADIASLFSGFVEAIRSGAVDHGWLPETNSYDIPWVLHLDRRFLRPCDLRQGTINQDFPWSLVR